MTRLADANLISLFDFYLASAALISVFRRFPVYADAVRVMFGMGGRWSRVSERLRANHGVLVTATVMRATGLALGLIAVQFLCSRVIWPQANLPLGEVLSGSWATYTIAAVALPMLMVDAYFLIVIGRFDRTSTEKYLDLAEHWLKSWKAPIIRTITFGKVDPHQMVEDEVRKGLSQMSQVVSWAMRWVAIQAGCRVTFGLVIWTIWAIDVWFGIRH